VKLAFRERSETKSTVELIPKSEASREGRRRSADDWSYTLDVNDQALFAGRGNRGFIFYSAAIFLSFTDFINPSSICRIWFLSPLLLVKA